MAIISPFGALIILVRALHSGKVWRKWVWNCKMMSSKAALQYNTLFISNNPNKNKVHQTLKANVRIKRIEKSVFLHIKGFTFDKDSRDFSSPVDII